MYTETLGSWSLWVFALGAFFILYSSTVSAVAAQSRVLPDYFIEFGFLSRDRVDRRKQITKWWILAPIAGFFIAVFIQKAGFTSFDNSLCLRFNVTDSNLGNPLFAKEKIAKRHSAKKINSLFS